MNITEKFKKSLQAISKVLWIVLIPIILDLFQLFTYEHIFKTIYTPVSKFLMIKIGLPTAPPSVNFLLEDFPTVIFIYSNNTITGIINTITPFNVLLILSFMLVMSFISSGYLSIIGQVYRRRVGVKDFFVLGNRLWFKFFIMNVITMIPLFLILIDSKFILLAIISVIFIYVEYSFVVDEVNIKENFLKGIGFLFNNIGLTIKLALYLGVIFTLVSVPVFMLASLGTMGVIISIIILGYLGTAANKTVLEIYREVSSNI